jgi:hypothetical protein
MSTEERDDKDFTDDAADALDESRRTAGEEGRTIEDQPGSLEADDPEAGDVSAY